MNKEEITISVNEEDVQNIINAYEKDIEYIEQLQQENERLKEKIENKDDWCQLIADIGYDYDGCRTEESLKDLIDELVEYALNSRNNYSYEEFLKEGSNE